MKEDEAKAKMERVRYVTAEEADKITGLDKATEEDTKGTKAFLSLMCVVS